MPSAKKQSVVDTAVQRYKASEEELQAFLTNEELYDVLRMFEHLVEERNRTLDAAMRAVKAELRHLDQDKLVMAGLGAQKKFKRWYDGDFLSRALPAAQADLILTERVVYDVNQDRLEQMARQGEVDNAIVAAAFREEEQSPAALPGSPKPYNIPVVPVRNG
jgi:hypothetical protein